MIPLGLRVATRLLTVLPIAWDAREESYRHARATVWFPLVGALVGAVVYAVLLTPLPSLPRAALALIAWIVLSRGLHEDALMDVTDAGLAMGDAAARERIRKDPHVGAHAVSASGLLLIARFAALTTIAPAAGLLSPIIGRWCMALTLAMFPAGGRGLGSDYGTGAAALPPSIIGTALLMTIAFWQDNLWIIAAGAAALTIGITAAGIIAKRLGRPSGDVHGAAGVIAETALLYALLVPARAP